MEVEKDYASKGVAGAGLGTGIAGLALGVMNAAGGLGALALGNRNPVPPAPVMPAMPYGYGWGGCSENMPVSRYELDREQQLAAKDSEIALLKANAYNDQKSIELYAYIDGQLKDIRKTLCDQAVHNQRTEDSFALVKQDVESVRKEALGAVKMEAERRCCGDNSIVTYVNATFYPKQVADVTTGTATTAQSLYNPIPKCGGCCNS